MTARNTVAELAAWFASQADGDWEHGEGIRIESLDNPGWFISISIRGTELESEPFDAVDEERAADDWLRCWRTGSSWEAACGPKNLDEAITRFLDWTRGAAVTKREDFPVG